MTGREALVMLLCAVVGWAILLATKPRHLR